MEAVAGLLMFIITGVIISKLFKLVDLKIFDFFSRHKKNRDK